MSEYNEVLEELLEVLRGKQFLVGNKVYEIWHPEHFYKAHFKSNIRWWPDSVSYTVRLWAYQKHWFWKFFPKRFYMTIFVDDINIKHNKDVHVKVEYWQDDCLRLKFVEIGDETLNQI